MSGARIDVDTALDWAWWTTVSTDSAIALWARSGAMALTSDAGGRPSVSGAGAAALLAASLEQIAELTERRTGSSVELPGVELLGERAAISGRRRSPGVSVGGATRTLRGLDGWLALTLSRPTDHDSIPALTETDDTGWPAVERWAASRPVGAAVERAGLLALAAAAIPDSTHDARPPVVTTAGRARPHGSPTRPLIVDLSSLWAGPLCTHLLGLSGAEVVKVDSAHRPDGARLGDPAFYDLLHAGHDSVVVDFQSPTGVQALRDLIARADVVVESARPRAMTQLGIDVTKVVAGGIIWASITAYGRTGPAANRVGFGDDVAAAAGLVAELDGIPVPVGDAIADPLAGAAAAGAVSDALLSAESRLIDISMYDVARAAARIATPIAEVSQTSDGWCVDDGTGPIPVVVPVARQPVCPPPMSLLIVNAEHGARHVDVRVDGGRVVAIEPDLTPLPTDDRYDAAGGALLPGLHDHHLHLHAMAAAAASIDCGPPAISTTTQLLDALQATARTADPTVWLRGVNYHDAVAGPLDRDALDRLIATHPVRIQHRSGALWILNSAALERQGWLGTDPLPPEVERGPDGRPTGRVWRGDHLWQRSGTFPDLVPVGRRLLALGITGVTDATPDLTAEAMTHLATSRTEGSLPQSVLALGAPADWTDGRIGIGPRKLLLHDHDLPTLDDLVDVIGDTHRTGRPVAVHCVTRTSLVLTVAALETVGRLEGDRIEHAGVVPPDLMPAIQALRLRVVTQPGFIRDRGDDYLADVDPADLPCLYPYASLVAAGLPVAPSSDAPFGDVDPWRVMAAASARRTASGRLLGEPERVDPHESLRGYLSPATAPGGSPRTVDVNHPADLCVLAEPIRAALATPCAEQVRLVIAGETTYLHT